MARETIEGIIENISSAHSRANPDGDWTLRLNGDRVLRIADGSFLRVEPRIGQSLRAVLDGAKIVEMELDGRDAFTSLHIRR
jgi:hypothetical protein